MGWAGCGRDIQASQDESPGAPEGRARRMAGLALGPALFAAMLMAPVPEGLSAAGWHVAALAVLTLAVILSEMSRSDAQLSERLWVR